MAAWGFLFAGGRRAGGRFSGPFIAIISGAARRQDRPHSGSPTSAGRAEFGERRGAHRRPKVLPGKGGRTTILDCFEPRRIICQSPTQLLTCLTTTERDSILARQRPTESSA